MLVLGAVPAAGQDGSSHAQDSLAIVDASRAFSDAYVRGDIATIVAAYGSGTGAMLPPDGRIVRDPAVIARYWTNPPQRVQVAHSMTSESLKIFGEVAVDIGTWRSVQRQGEDDPAEATGRYLVVWRRDGQGHWVMEADMWHRPVR